MKKRKATLVGIINKTCIANLKVGDVVSFEEEPTNTTDPNAIKVLCDGQLAGYLGQKIVLDETDDVATVKGYINQVESGTIESLSESEDNPKIWIGMISFNMKEESQKKPEKKSRRKKANKKDVAEFCLIGNRVKYPFRQPFMEGFEAGKREKVMFRMDGDNVVAIFKGETIGTVEKDNDRIDDLVGLLATKDVLGEACRIEDNKIYIHVDMADNSSLYDEQIARLIEKGFDEEEITERISYMKKANVSMENINIVLNQIQDFPPALKRRIKKPEALFIEYGSYISDSIEELNAGSYLRFIGNKACGKNTLTETLAWLYHRPLFELPGNESTDKTDLEGSLKLETNENGELNTPYEISPVIEALESGGFLVIDEVNLIRAGALSVLNGLDSRKRLEISGYGRVEVDSGARVILTMNEGYIATMPLNEATSDRFEPIVFEDPETIEPLLQGLFPEAPKEMISICQTVYKALKEMNAEGTISSYAISIRGMRSAIRLALNNNKSIAKYLHQKIAGRGQDVTERMVIHGIIKDITGE
jgi:hypothetical protein